MMTAAPTFGGWLKRRRLSQGLTQKELARQVGYAQVTLRKVEADELRPSGQMARKLAEALELAPEEQTQFVRFARDEVDDPPERLLLPDGNLERHDGAVHVAHQLGIHRLRRVEDAVID